MKQAIVTGAAGFLGFCIAKQLADRPDFEVVCVDNFSRGVSDEAYRKLSERENVTLVNADLTDREAVGSLPTSADYVFHMAALNGTENFYARPFEVLRSCTLPTIYLIEHLGVSRSASRFVYAGTSEAYAATVSRFDWPLPTAEDVPLCIDDPYNARWSYGASKLHGEIATINGCRHFGIPFTIVRYHNAYGPRMGDKHVIPDFLMRVRRKEYSLFGASDTRSFIFGDDAAAATIALAQADGAKNETFNVGGRYELSMLELAQTMMKVCGITGEIIIHPSPKGSVARRCPDVTKAVGVIGEFEVVGLEEGLRRTAAFYLK